MLEVRKGLISRLKKVSRLPELRGVSLSPKIEIQLPVIENGVNLSREIGRCQLMKSGEKSSYLPRLGESVDCPKLGKRSVSILERVVRLTDFEKGFSPSPKNT